MKLDMKRMNAQEFKGPLFSELYSLSQFDLTQLTR